MAQPGCVWDKVATAWASDLCARPRDTFENPQAKKSGGGQDKAGLSKEPSPLETSIPFSVTEGGITTERRRDSLAAAQWINGEFCAEESLQKRDE